MFLCVSVTVAHLLVLVAFRDSDSKPNSPGSPEMGTTDQAVQNSVTVSAESKESDSSTSEDSGAFEQASTLEQVSTLERASTSALSLDQGAYSPGSFVAPSDPSPFSSRTSDEVPAPSRPQVIESKQDGQPVQPVDTKNPTLADLTRGAPKSSDSDESDTAVKAATGPSRRSKVADQPSKLNETSLAAKKQAAIEEHKQKERAQAKRARAKRAAKLKAQQKVAQQRARRAAEAKKAKREAEAAQFKTASDEQPQPKLGFFARWSCCSRKSKKVSRSRRSSSSKMTQLHAVEVDEKLNDATSITGNTSHDESNDDSSLFARGRCNNWECTCDEFVPSVDDMDDVAHSTCCTCHHLFEEHAVLQPAQGQKGDNNDDLIDLQLPSDFDRAIDEEFAKQQRTSQESSTTPTSATKDPLPGGTAGQRDNVDGVLPAHEGSAIVDPNFAGTENTPATETDKDDADQHAKLDRANANSSDDGESSGPAAENVEQPTPPAAAASVSGNDLSAAEQCDPSVPASNEIAVNTGAGSSDDTSSDASQKAVDNAQSEIESLRLAAALAKAEAEAQRVAAQEAEAELHRVEVERARLETERAQAEAEAIAAAERLAAEKSKAEAEIEAARKETAAAEAKAEADRIASEEAKAEAERIATEKVKAEAERIAAEKAKAEAERIAAENAEAERVAAQKAKAEAERIAAEKAEAERIAAEKAEAERIAAEKAEAERIAAEKAEAERIAAEKAEAERIAAEKAEAERIAAEKAEAERIAAEKAEAERIAAEKAEAERIAAEKAEAERIAAEKAEAERIAAEKAEAARIAAQNVNTTSPSPSSKKKKKRKNAKQRRKAAAAAARARESAQSTNAPSHGAHGALKRTNTTVAAESQKLKIMEERLAWKNEEARRQREEAEAADRALQRHLFGGHKAHEVVDAEAGARANSLVLESAVQDAKTKIDAAMKAEKEAEAQKAADKQAKARQDAVALEKAVEDAKIKVDAELNAQKEAEARRAAEKEAKARADAIALEKAVEDAKAKVDAEMKAKKEAEAQQAAEAEAKARADALALEKAVEDAKAKVDAEMKAKKEAEAQQAAEAQAKARADALALEKAVEDAKAKVDAEMKAQKKAETLQTPTAEAMAHDTTKFASETNQSPVPSLSTTTPANDPLQVAREQQARSWCLHERTHFHAVC